MLTALGNQNLILPGGTAKIGQFEYDVDLNADPKSVDGVEQSSHQDCRRLRHLSPRCRDRQRRFCSADQYGSLRTAVAALWLRVLKAGDASTIDVVKGIRKLLPRVAQTLPPAIEDSASRRINRSLFAASINGVVREAIIAAALTGLMILMFLGSWRSTLIIAISIPLSILTSVLSSAFCTRPSTS